MARIVPLGARLRYGGRSLPWLAAGIAVATLLASSLLAYRLSPNQVNLVIVGLIGLGGVLILLRWPQLGLILASFGGMVLPTVGPMKVNVPMLLIALLSGLWVVDMVARQRAIHLVPSRTMRPMLALIVVIGIAFLFGQLPWFNFVQNAPVDAQLAGMAIYLLSAMAFVLVANLIRDLRWLKALVWAFMAMGAFYVIVRAMLPLSRPIMSLFQAQATGPMFWTWFPAIAMSQALFNRDLRPRWRALLLGLVALAVYVAFVQAFKWKSGWVPTLAVIGILTMLYSWRLGVLVGLIAAPMLLGLGQSTLASEEYSASTRVEAWAILMELIRVSPLLGLGFANYYWYTPLIPIRGWYVRFNSHNNFVDLVAQTGLLGLACFVWFFAEIGRLGWTLRNRVPDHFSRAYVNGALAAAGGMLVAAMLGDWVLSFVYNVGMDGFKTGVTGWLFLGGLVTIERLYAAER